MDSIQPLHAQQWCRFRLKMGKFKPKMGLGKIRSWICGKSHESSKCGAVFICVIMINRGATNIVKRYHGAFHNFQDNHPRKVKAAPDSSDFSFAI
jgi:hypothetical protein